MESLPVQRAAQLSLEGAQTQWLIEELWGQQAVGILGGEPKCCKSFLALDIAVSVASGAPCLRHFPVRRRGTVLLYPAEDSLAVVRRRLEGICAAAEQSLQSLPIEVITASSLRLDLEADRQRLKNTVQALGPTLLILDPLIRLHRLEENDATQIAGLLSFLRELQRVFELSILLVHHARKGAANARPGQALRGSSELHGWGDSNLYMRRRRTQLTLTTEHRAAAGREAISLRLVEEGPGLALALAQGGSEMDPGEDELAESSTPSPGQRIRQALAGLDHPVSGNRLRQLCAMKRDTLSKALNQLCQEGIVQRLSQGYRLVPRLTDSDTGSLFDPSIGSEGNGNGKHLPAGRPPK